MGRDNSFKVSNKAIKEMIKNRAEYIQKYTIIANEFLRDNYDLVLSIPIVFKMSNGDSVMGSFSMTEYEREDGTKFIIPKYVSINFIEVMISELSKDKKAEAVLKHELVHYALFMLGIPHSDGCKEFEDELRRLSLPSSTTSNSVVGRKLINHVEYTSVEDGSLVALQDEDYSSDDVYGRVTVSIGDSTERIEVNRKSKFITAV